VIIAEELLRDRVVCNEDVGPAITIEVVDRYPQPFPRRTSDATLLGNIRERSVSVVVKHEVRDRFELVGVAIGAIAGTVFATVNFREVPLHITTDDQIQPPIAVVVNEARARAPSAAAHACLGRNIGERAVAVVVIKNIPTEVRHQEIDIAIVVVVSSGDPHAIEPPLQPSLLSNVCKGAVAIVVI